MSFIDGPGVKDLASGKIAASDAHPLFGVPFFMVANAAILEIDV